MAILLFQGNKEQSPLSENPFHTIDALLAALYQVISENTNLTRNWAIFRKLFRSEARINALGKDNQGKERYLSLTIEDYIRGLEASHKRHKILEIEIGRKVEKFGDMVHVLSTCETQNAFDQTVLQQGVNSIQLVFREDRYWIVSMVFSPASAENPITENHLFPKIEEVKKPRKAIYQK